jgi:STE24 endopeptidase
MQIGFINFEKRREPFLLSTEKYRKAGDYSVEKEKLSIVSTLIEYGLFIFWIRDGLELLQGCEVINSFGGNITLLLFVFGFLGINYLITLPTEIYEKFIIDKKHGFNRSTAGLYVIDQIKGAVLSVLIGSPIILGVIYFVESSELWWLYSFALIFSVIVFLNMVYPTLIAPMYNKMSPLEDSELNGKIEALLQKVGFQSSGVFTIDASKRDSRLNAYFGGFGKSKRVVLFDTLIEKLNHQELLAVLGHELGHFKHGDVYKNIAIMGILIFSIFGIIGNIPDSLYSDIGVEKSGAVLISIFMLVSSIIGFFAMPIIGAVSRHNEYRADEMGSKLSGSSLYLKEALRKLVIENRSFPKSHPIYIFFYYTHPPVSERLKELEKKSV